MQGATPRITHRARIRVPLQSCRAFQQRSVPWNSPTKKRHPYKLCQIKERWWLKKQERRSVGCGEGHAPFLKALYQMQTRHHGHRISLLLSADDGYRTTSEGSNDSFRSWDPEGTISPCTHSDKNWWTREGCNPERATHQKLCQRINKDTDHSSGDRMSEQSSFTKWLLPSTVG